MANLQYSQDSWLGEVPAHWATVPAKALFSNRVERNHSDDVHLTPSQKYGVIPQAEYMEITGSRVVLNLSGSDNMRHVEPGDYISHLRSFQGGLEYSACKGKVSSAYTVLSPKRVIEPRYYKYLFKSNRYVQGLSTTTEQLRDGQSIRYEQFALLPLPFPPLEEQKAIADFLDDQLLTIDLLIEKQQNLVSLLDEKLKVEVHSAVTKGLTKKYAIQNSGIEWAPEVPNDWAILKASRLFKARKGSRAALLSTEYCGEHPGDYPVFSGQTENDGIMAKINTFEFDFVNKPVLFTTTVGSSRVMSVSMLEGKFSLSQNCMIMQNTAPEILDTRFAYWLLTVAFDHKKRQLAQHMQLSFRMSDLYSYRFPIPPLPTQQEIAGFIDSLEQQNRALKDAALASIRLLQERRAALISAAVTGKIELRGKR